MLGDPDTQVGLPCRDFALSTSASSSSLQADPWNYMPL